MLKKIIIFGTGSHSKVVINEILKQNIYKISYFVDQKKNSKKIKVKKKSIIVKSYKNFRWSKFIDKNTFGFVAIGNNYTRKKIVSEVEKKIKNFKWAVIKSPDALVSKDVKVKPGTLIVTGSVINPGSKIGSHCIINTKSSIDHDNIFEDFSSCGPGVVTGGNVFLGSLSYIGIGSTILNDIKIKANTIVGAKSLVNKNCISNSIYYGSPAKKIKKNIKKNYL